MVNLIKISVLDELSKWRLRNVSITTRARNKFPGLFKREGYLKKREIIMISSASKMGQTTKNMIRFKVVNGSALL